MEVGLGEVEEGEAGRKEDDDAHRLSYLRRQLVRKISECLTDNRKVMS